MLAAVKAMATVTAGTAMGSEVISMVALRMWNLMRLDP